MRDCRILIYYLCAPVRLILFCWQWVAPGKHNAYICWFCVIYYRYYRCTMWYADVISPPDRQHDGWQLIRTYLFILYMELIVNCMPVYFWSNRKYTLYRFQCRCRAWTIIIIQWETTCMQCICVIPRVLCVLCLNIITLRQYVHILYTYDMASNRFIGEAILSALRLAMVNGWEGWMHFLCGTVFFIVFPGKQRIHLPWYNFTISGNGNFAL